MHTAGKIKTEDIRNIYFREDLKIANKFLVFAHGEMT